MAGKMIVVRVTRQDLRRLYLETWPAAQDLTQEELDVFVDIDMDLAIRGGIMTPMAPPRRTERED